MLSSDLVKMDGKLNSSFNFYGRVKKDDLISLSFSRRHNDLDRSIRNDNIKFIKNRLNNSEFI